MELATLAHVDGQSFPMNNLFKDVPFDAIRAEADAHAGAGSGVCALSQNEGDGEVCGNTETEKDFGENSLPLEVQHQCVDV